MSVISEFKKEIESIKRALSTKNTWRTAGMEAGGTLGDSTIYHGQRVETQVSINFHRYTHKNVGYVCDGMLYRHTKEQKMTYATPWLILDFMLKEISHKRMVPHIRSSHIHRRRVEW